MFGGGRETVPTDVKIFQQMSMDRVNMGAKMSVAIRYL
jgi:hypothetical protein